jgi:hypothetical protein
MATVSVYNHTALRFLNGANSSADTYKLMLCTASTFNAADTTLASITKTEVANGNGYTTSGQALTGVSIATVTTNDAVFDADDVQWTIVTAAVSANSAILYNDTDTSDPPVLHIDFGGTRTVQPGNTFGVAWNADGIYRTIIP